MTAKTIIGACLAVLVMFVATARGDPPAVLTLCWCILIAGIFAGDK